MPIALVVDDEEDIRSVVSFVLKRAGFDVREVCDGAAGLAMARSVIVERHQGELRFETESGQGTCFIVRLPINPPPAAKPHPLPG